MWNRVPRGGVDGVSIGECLRKRTILWRQAAARDLIWCLRNLLGATPLNDLGIHLENDSDSQLDQREGVGDGKEVVRINGKIMKQTCADV